MRRSSSPAMAARHSSPRTSFFPNNFRPSPPPHHPNRGPHFPPYHGRDRPANFVLQLRSDHRGFRKQDVEALIAKCRSSPDRWTVFGSGSVAATLSFCTWLGALEAIVCLWELRLDGDHGLTPKLVANVTVPNRMSDLRSRLGALFRDRARALLEGEAVSKCRQNLDRLRVEIARLSTSLRRPNPFELALKMRQEKQGYEGERCLIEKRLREFRAAMDCIMGFLEGDKCGEEGFRVFKLDGDFNWSRIHVMMLRECRRLEDGLPIYAYRGQILSRIHQEQVTVLIGETGSGKSTQLVQFLADSGVAADESIVCTQPRKIAALSLADRVRDESKGCYEDKSVTCHPTFASAQQFDSKVIFMTDHCLLQHYMHDKNLSGISCIIIDEAHERSLNTDLLLALVKDLLTRRFDLRLVIMSATADANQLSEYFFGCRILHVEGRNFSVDVRYVPCVEATSGSGGIPSYVSDVVKKAVEIHSMENEGTVLAFLTSQMEVEMACEKFRSLSAIALPLHGKLSSDEQSHVFHDYPGKRKVIFSTNLAETSLTIPGVKYVIDSGMIKESKYEPGTGMNVLKVGRISQSSAKQRAGRAGRTEPGICYRLYSESDFQSMPANQEPEIRRVHLGVAVLRILALGIKNVQEFDFVDAPSSEAIDMAVRNLVQLGAIIQQNNGFQLTEEGRELVKLGIEPRLGKLILNCFRHRLGREGVVLAALMTNASSIFCRVGTYDDKQKSDRLKVKFCHQNGDLFTLLSVYKEWMDVHPDERKRNGWCWENSINAKSMRRCHGTVTELESCLEKELNKIVPTYWVWDPHRLNDADSCLKKVVLSSLGENVAMYSGYDQLGYEVAMTGQHVQLHPSCSLLIFAQKPSWVVFSELLSISNQYLVCVTAVDFDSLSTLCPPPLFDVSKMERHKLLSKVLSGVGTLLLERFCGRLNNNLVSLVSRLRTTFLDERIGVEVNIDQNEIVLFASAEDMENVFNRVSDVLEFEQKLLKNECLEKYLYHVPGVSSSVALVGAGAVIKHLELQKKYMTVDVSCSNYNDIEDKELLMFLENQACGSICAVQKFTSIVCDGDDKVKWGRITFLNPDAAKRLAEFNEIEFGGSILKIIPSRVAFVGDKMFSFPAVRAKVYWPRRSSRGFAIVRCDSHDVPFMVNDCSNLAIGGKYVRCEAGRRSEDCVVIGGIDKELSESDIFDALRTATNRRIHDIFLVRGDAVENPPCGACEEAILKEISPFMPKKNPHTNCCRVQVYPPEPKDTFMKALITFDGRLHLEAATALEQIEGKVLPGCLPWQKIKCQQLFQSSLSCSASIYSAIKKQLDSLLGSFKHVTGAECSLDRNYNGSYRVKISANATKTVAELRRPMEELMKGKPINHVSLSPAVLQLLFSREGIFRINSVQKETGTYIFFDKPNHNVKIFGSSDSVEIAEQKLISSLLALHESKQLEIHLRGRGRRPDLMKMVVERFGPDLSGLKDEVPGGEFTLNTRQHVIHIQGNLELRQKVEEILQDISQTSTCLEKQVGEAACPICLCEVEQNYRLESCGHLFCRSCLVEQLESAIRSRDSFPICCTKEGCKDPILVPDLRSLLTSEKLEELFRASLASFVASSEGTYRFCPSPDCPSVYRVADPGMAGEPFVCGACHTETCTRCHLEYHQYLSCEMYKQFKEDPDSSLKEWRKGKDHVKSCPGCEYTIEKVDGCNHVECKCGKHICWNCLSWFNTSDECYTHLRSVHLAIL